MIEKISKWILNKIISKNESEEKKNILLFGIIRIVEDIPKMVTIFLVCIFLGLIKELFVTFLVVAVYKPNIGGVHCKSNFGCFINTLLFFLICIYGSKYIILKFTYKAILYLILYLIGLYVILVYAPADVPEIPIISTRIRKRAKIVSLIFINLIYIICIFLIKNEIYQNILIYTMFYINIMATRTMYKFFKNKYGYENYIPDELIID